MDTSRTAEKVEADRQTIKTCMPETYRSIQARAADSDLGRQAYALVTRGLRGEPNCFYAVERGHVVGTPFDVPGVSEELARYMVRFGVQSLVMWAPVAGGGAGGGGGAKI